MKAGHNKTTIARSVGVHKSTICREVARNSELRGYRPRQAQQFYLDRRVCKHKPRITLSTWAIVSHYLQQEWSPEQISHRLSAEHLRVESAHFITVEKIEL